MVLFKFKAVAPPAFLAEILAKIILNIENLISEHLNNFLLRNKCEFNSLCLCWFKAIIPLDMG